jgi:hypothetical protein
LTIRKPDPAPSASPRATAIEALYQHAAGLVAAGDLQAARAIHAAIGAMLAEPPPDGGGRVLDLGAERERRR